MNKTKIIRHHFQFGGSNKENDKLAQKVLRGEKTATSSLYDYYLLNKKEMSRVGDWASVIDSKGQEICIVRINRVQIINFGNITEKFAREEGDGSLENWLEIHTKYYSYYLEELGKILRTDTKLVCEWFNVMEN